MSEKILVRKSWSNILSAIDSRVYLKYLITGLISEFDFSEVDRRHK